MTVVSRAVLADCIDFQTKSFVARLLLLKCYWVDLPIIQLDPELVSGNGGCAFYSACLVKQLRCECE